MSLFLTEDQKLIQQSVREFCQSPAAAEAVAADRQQGGFPHKSWKLAAEQGYVSAWVPEEYGGMGYSMTTYYVILEELTRGGFPAANSFGGHDLGLLPLVCWGTEEQKKKFLPGLASGEKIASGAVTDPAGLSNYPMWGFTAEEHGDDYIINAQKVMVSNADVSDVKIIFGRPAGSHFDSVFIIEKEREGVESGLQEKKLVPGQSDWGSINIKDVRVPKDHRVVDNGFGQNFLGASFSSIALTALVLGEGGFAIARNYTSQRLKYGRPLDQLQTVSHKLMDMAVSSQAGRELIYAAARLWDEGRFDEAYRLGIMSKIFVPPATTRALHEATILHGGIGFTPQARIGVMWSAAIQLEIAELPVEVHKDLLAETYGIKTGWMNDHS